MDLIIGTYTEELPHVHGKADGVLVASFDPASGRIGPVTPLAAARNPSYLATSASGERVYAVHETVDFGDQPGGGITAYARDPRSGELTALNARATLGDSPCHVTLDRSGRFVLNANYGSDAGSVTVHRIEPDGRLGEMTDHVEHAGSGPDPVRQANSHVHMIAVDPVTGDILVSDLGSDTVFGYTLDRDGRLVARASANLAAVPGAGPRHLAFHPDGRHLFVVNELDSSVCALRRDGDHFTLTGRVPTRGADPAGADPAGADPAGADQAGADPATAGQNLAGAVRVTPSGRHVLVSNRGDDSLAVLRFDPDSSALSLVGITPEVGECPRDFIVTPDGRHVIVASQDGDRLASYRFDDESGALRLLHSVVAPTPVCLVLM
jgi:6-phosphogluconolactonase